MTSILYIGNALTRSGNTLTTIEYLSSLLREEGFLVTVASSKQNKLLRMLDMLYGVYKNRKSCDIVLIDTYSTQNFYYAVLVASLCKKFKLPYIPILHGGSLPKRLKKSPSLSVGLFNSAKINVAPSRYLVEAFAKAGYSHVTHIPNSIELDKYKYKSRTKISPKLLWVRSFHEIYNPILALEVVALLKVKYPDISLCMIGPDKDGSLEKCKAYASKNNLDVTFTGGLPKQEWLALAAKYDVFINTTNFDNTPVSVIEAMALGLPVVSTNVGGIPYLITHNKNGLLVSKNDAEAMADQIECLLIEPALCKEITSEALEVVKTYDWKNVKAQWIALLNK